MVTISMTVETNAGGRWHIEDYIAVKLRSDDRLRRVVLDRSPRTPSAPPERTARLDYTSPFLVASLQAKGGVGLLYLKLSLIHI